MSVDINKLIIQFAGANLEVDDIYRITIPVGSISRNHPTMAGVCGIVVPVSGRAKFTVCDVEYQLKPGVILHAGSNMKLTKEVIGNSKWEYMLLHYRVAGDEKERARLENLQFSVNIGLNYNQELAKLLRRLMISQESASILSSLQSKAILYSIIDCILQHAQEKSLGTEEEEIGHVISYIHSNFDKNITVQEMADKVNMDKKRFCYLFDKKVGMSPKKYLIQYRIKHAKEMLIQDDYGISEVAKMTGYEDALHFSRIFRKKVGMPPSVFRESFGKKSI